MTKVSRSKGLGVLCLRRKKVSFINVDVYIVQLLLKSGKCEGVRANS